MKIIVAFVLVAIIFTPSTVFGWRSINEADIKCIVDCNFEYGSLDSSRPVNFIMLGMLLLVGLGLFMKYNQLGKYETFSINCKTCKRNTRGLKCPLCESEKQSAV
ncbi:MAG: hypothetical protein ACT4NJ_02115 [Nitrosopumilaceae archaeon]